MSKEEIQKEMDRILEEQRQKALKEAQELKR